MPAPAAPGVQKMYAVAKFMLAYVECVPGEGGAVYACPFGKGCDVLAANAKLLAPEENTVLTAHYPIFDLFNLANLLLPVGMRFESRDAWSRALGQRGKIVFGSLSDSTEFERLMAAVSWNSPREVAFFDGSCGDAGEQLCTAKMRRIEGGRYRLLSDETAIASSVRHLKEGLAAVGVVEEDSRLPALLHKHAVSLRTAFRPAGGGGLGKRKRPSSQVVEQEVVVDPKGPPLTGLGFRVYCLGFRVWG
jgi:hypothetical protein